MGRKNPQTSKYPYHTLFCCIHQEFIQQTRFVLFALLDSRGEEWKPYGRSEIL
jgi:hypothetical protein